MKQNIYDIMAQSGNINYLKELVSIIDSKKKKKGYNIYLIKIISLKIKI